MAEDSSPSKAELRRLLSEREKELDALYELASLFAQPGESRESIIDGTASIVRKSMQYPDRDVARVQTDDIPLDPGGSKELTTSYRIEK